MNVKKPETGDDGNDNNVTNNDNNNAIMANNANMFQYHAHSNDNIANNDVDDADNDANNANEQDHRYLGYNASIQLTSELCNKEINVENKVSNISKLVMKFYFFLVEC